MVKMDSFFNERYRINLSSDVNIAGLPGGPHSPDPEQFGRKLPQG